MSKTKYDFDNDTDFFKVSVLYCLIDNYVLKLSED